MANYDFLSASDGTGDASLMHITATRIVGATAITVDTVVGVPAKFIGTSGNLLSTGLLDPTTVTNFRGHTASGALQIDAFEPGSTDKGNTATQVVIIKPNTGWANRVATFIQNATGFGTPEAHTTSSIANSGSITTGSLNNSGAYTGTNGSISSAYLTNPYKFSAYRAAAGTYSGTDVVFDTKNFDIGNNYSTSTGRFTAPVAGFYFLNACLGYNWTPSAGRAIGTNLSKNGTSLALNGFVGNYSGSYGQWDMLVTKFVSLAAGDYVTVQDYGGSGLTMTPGQANMFFEGFLISQT